MSNRVIDNAIKTAPADNAETMHHLKTVRLLLWIGAFALLCATVILSAPFLGSPILAISAAWESGTKDAQIFAFRLPRAIAAGVAGAGLATAGATLQALVRNPLADPYTLGMASGSSFGAVLAIHLGIGSSIPIAAFIGAALTAAVVYRLAQVGSTLPPATLLLAGVTVSLMCSAGIMVVQAFADWTSAYRMARWFMGGLDVVTFAQLRPSGFAVALGIALMWSTARELNALATSEEMAASVGVSVLSATTRAYVGAAIAVAGAVSLAGPVGFVGLVVPHVLRSSLGPDHRLLLPLSALCGAIFVCICDVLARTLFFPRSFPVGVLTALLGGPFFLALLVRSRRSGGFWG